MVYWAISGLRYEYEEPGQLGSLLLSGKNDIVLEKKK